MVKYLDAVDDDMGSNNVDNIKALIVTLDKDGDGVVTEEDFEKDFPRLIGNVVDGRLTLGVAHV